MNLQTLKQQIIAAVSTLQDEVLLQKVIDLLLQHSFSKTNPPINDTDLTQTCMITSEKSLAQGWDKEDDERWNKFLKN